MEKSESTSSLQSLTSVSAQRARDAARLHRALLKQRQQVEGTHQVESPPRVDPEDIFACQAVADRQRLLLQRKLAAATREIWADMLGNRPGSPAADGSRQLADGPHDLRSASVPTGSSASTSTTHLSEPLTRRQPAWFPHGSN